jgi:hypothetical protein
MSEVTQEHLQNLVSQGFMTVAELMSCRMPQDLASPMPVWVWGAITLISPLCATVLWSGTAPLDSLRDLVHDSLCDLVRGLHGDRAPLPTMEELLSCPALVGLGCGSGGVG